MAIQELPPNTVRALGANQALTDPASLVKELIDNALDANANSISVEISNNTIDVIQVRDNGHGIAPVDRELVARRYCTSKISRHQDLKDIGGSSLGFRGEALASAAELSGGMVITTRVEGEEVATALKISQKGEIVSQDRASSSVGTTIKVTEFIKANPVRKQVALKNTEACLKKIKRTLQAYAFARPHVRLSLRVLKAKNTKGDWVYAPKPGGNAEDAAFKVVGAACSSQCVWSVLEERGFTLQAFLPRPDADLNKVCNMGTFLSIDARPVSTFRGRLKQMAKIFRDSLKMSHPNHGEIKEPFLFLEISCPQGAYDANIEPAKDDVLFEDADVVIEMVKQLFRTVYEPAVNIPAPIEEPARAQPARHQHIDAMDDLTMSFDGDLPTALPERTSAVGGTRELNAYDIQDDIRGEADNASTMAPASERRAFRSTMYGCDEEDVDLFQEQPLADTTTSDLVELRQARNDKSLNNPWTLAKMNTSIRHPASTADLPAESLYSSSPLRPEPPGRQSIPAGLPTPRPSSPSPSDETFHPSRHVPQIRIARDGRVFDNSPSLPPPQRAMPTPMNLRPRRDVTSPSFGQDMTPSVYRGSPQPRGEESPAGTPLDAIPQASARSSRSPTKRQQTRVNKPCVPPTREQLEREEVWFDNGENIGRRGRGAGRAFQSQANANVGNLVVQGELGDLVDDGRILTPPQRNRDIRDFVDRDMSGGVGNFIERRNFSRAEINVSRDADEEQLPTAPALQGFVRASELDILDEEAELPEKPQERASKRRKTADRQALQELSANTDPATIVEDEEEYRPAASTRALSRRRSSKSGRSKSSRLPLERTPAGKRVHDLAVDVVIDTDELARLAGQIDGRSLLGYNEPSINADDGTFTDLLSNLDGLTTKLHRLLLAAGSASDADIEEDANSSLVKLRGEVQAAYSRYEEQMVNLDLLEGV